MIVSENPETWNFRGRRKPCLEGILIDKFMLAKITKEAFGSAGNPDPDN